MICEICNEDKEEKDIFINCRILNKFLCKKCMQANNIANISNYILDLWETIDFFEKGGYPE